MLDLYLVRHGITAANRNNRFAGRSSEELLPEGLIQIRQVAHRLDGFNIGAVYCGPARRTMQSAEIIGSVLDVPVSSQQGLDEIYLPHWDGLTKEEITQKFGSQYPTWLTAPDHFSVNGCESLLQVQNRAVTAVKHLLKTHPQQNLLLVSHLIVLRCLVLYFRNLELQDFRKIEIDNGSIIRISGFGTQKMSFKKF